jgi:hypothetical protein
MADWYKHGGRGVSSIPSRLAELGFASYREYLASDHWADVRARFSRSKLVTRDAAGRLCCAGCLQSDIKIAVHVSRARLK